MNLNYETTFGDILYEVKIHELNYQPVRDDIDRMYNDYLKSLDADLCLEIRYTNIKSKHIGNLIRYIKNRKIKWNDSDLLDNNGQKGFCKSKKHKDFMNYITRLVNNISFA